MRDKPCRACRTILRWANLRDKWGRYSICSGHEAPGKCFWCGAEVKGRRFCAFIGPVKSYLDPYTHKWRQDEQPQPYCSFQYWRHFGWNSASAWCWEKADGKCQECGTYTEPPSRRTHHIQPLNGQPRSVSILNRPENLSPLCAHHHGLAHAAQTSTALKKAHAQARAIRDRQARQGKPAVFLCPLHGEVVVPLTGRKKQDARTWAGVELQHQVCLPKPSPLEETRLERWREWATA